jgi:aspartate racemase
MKTVGVIGGMGPAATLDFLCKLHAATPAMSDADHRHVITDNDPRRADRNAAMRADGQSPAPSIVATVHALIAAGAEVLVMPCNAAHAWAGDIVAAAGPVPFVRIIAAAVAAVRAAVPGVTRVGLLAVEATHEARLYDDGFGPGVTILGPDMTAFMPLIFAVKAGDTGPATRAAMAAQGAALVAAGAQVLVAACTEVPLVFGPGDASVPVVSATDALVAATLAAAL